MRKLIIAISFLAITGAAFAGNNNTATALTPEKKLDFSIRNQVSYPNFLLEKEGEHTAEVHFTINADGTINVKDIVSEEQDLKANLMNQIKDFSVNTGGLDLTETYKVVLRFNTIMQD